MIVRHTKIWRALLACSVVLLVLANIGLWTNRTLADEERFADAAAEVLDRDEVRRELADSIVREVMAGNPVLYRLAARPAEIAVADLLATRGMQATLQSIARLLHRMLTTDERPAFIITQPLLQAIALTVAVVAPLQAASLTFDGSTTQVEMFARQDVPSYKRYVKSMRVVGPLAGLAGLVLLAASALDGGSRSRGLKRTAFALVATSAVTLLLIVPLRAATVAPIDDPAARTVVAGVYGEFVWLLVAQTAVLLIVGVVLWLVAARLQPRTAEATNVAPAGE